MQTLRYFSTNVWGSMKIHQVRWCTLNKLEIRFQYVSNTLQYVSLVQDCVMTRSLEFGFGVWRKDLAEPCFGVRVRSSEKGSGLTLVWQVWSSEKERASPGSAGSEFGERNGPNPGSSGSEKGMGRTLVRQVWSLEKGMGGTLICQVRSSEKRQG